MPGTPADVTPPTASLADAHAWRHEPAGRVLTVRRRSTRTSTRPPSPMTVKTSGGSTVSGTTSYDPATRKATFTPTSALARGRRTSSRSPRPTSPATRWPPQPPGPSRPRMPDPTPGVCPCGLWSDATGPGTLTDPDADPIELGTAFSADTDGSITAVRFYKGPQNTGTHTVSLWTSTGTRLATAAVDDRVHHRLADRSVRRAGPGDGRHGIRRLVPRTQRPLLGNRLRSREPHRPAAPAHGRQRGALPLRRRVPRQHLGRELPRRPRVRHGVSCRPTDTTAPTISNVRSAARGRRERSPGPRTSRRPRRSPTARRRRR